MLGAKVDTQSVERALHWRCWDRSRERGAKDSGVCDRCGGFGDAAGFLDPVFSSGVTLALRGAELLVAGLGVRGSSIAYGASKGALNALTKGLAASLGRDGIQINALTGNPPATIN